MAASQLCFQKYKGVDFRRERKKQHQVKRFLFKVESTTKVLPPKKTDKRIQNGRPHIPEERAAFHPALKADKPLAKQGKMRRLDMEEALSEKACRM